MATPDADADAPPPDESAAMKALDDMADRWLRRGRESLTPGEARVLASAVARRTLSCDVDREAGAHDGRGARLADSIARIGGSWTFILSFAGFLLVWTLGNVMLGKAAFDPFPFIFLNLMLSMLAAFQAPVIMMSQNRQGERERLDAVHDYEVNLKADIEIMALHEKLDQMRRTDLAGMQAELARLAAVLGRLAPPGEPAAGPPR